MKADSAIPKPPGESTVYRLIKQLVESGEVKRTVRGNSRTFVYQLTDGESCHHHLHMYSSLVYVKQCKWTALR